MPQDVEFFGHYGFSNPILIVHGGFQLIGGTMLIFPKTRFLGSAIVAVTFLISAVVLIMTGNTLFTTITFVAMPMLGLVMKQSLSTGKLAPAQDKPN